MTLVCRLLIPVVPVLFFISCYSGHTEREADVNPYGWKASEPALIIVGNTDTVSRRGIFIFFRYDGREFAGALPLKVGCTSPDGLFFEEFFNVELPAATKVAEQLFAYRSESVLDRAGDYIFSIAPVEGTITGISSVGIKMDYGE